MKIFIFLSLFLTCCAGDGSDDLYRDYFMPFAAAAYSDTPQQCFKNILNNDNYQSQKNNTLSVRNFLLFFLLLIFTYNRFIDNIVFFVIL